MSKPLTELQKKVLSKANEICSKESWYSGGYCLDNFPTDEEIEKNFDEAVESVVCLTVYWDGTGFEG